MRSGDSSSKKTARHLNINALIMIVLLAAFLVIFIPFVLSKDKEPQEPLRMTVIDTQEDEKSSSGYVTLENPATVEEKPVPEFNYSDELKIDPGKLEAVSAVLYDVGSNTVIFRKNSQKAMFPASTTKIMTAVVALKYLPADYRITVGTELSLLSPESSLAYLNQGFVLTLEDALYALLLPSGNDAAYTIAANTARYVSKNSMMNDAQAVAYFCDLMNEEAERAGAFHTHFCNPDGYQDVFHYTTAEDMIRIAMLTSEYPLIAQIASAPFRETTLISGETRYWENGNLLVAKDSQYYVPYATGLKTGFTDEAGFSMVASASGNGHDLIAVVLKASSLKGRYTDAANMIYSLLEPAKAFPPPVTEKPEETQPPEAQ